MIDITKFEGHTRGSWRASEVMAHSAGFAIESEAGEQLARVMKTHGPEKLPSRANARLLAAAPDLLAEVVRLRAALEAITGQRDCALSMLAGWCVDVDRNGTGWDGWDENYKDAMYRPGPLRKELDAAIAAEIASRDGAA